MKKCPFCNEDIEDSAEFCLYCMRSLTPKVQILPPKKKPNYILIVTAVAAVLLILALVLMLFTSLGRSGQGNGGSSDDTLSDTASSDAEPPHTHAFHIENTEAKYQKAEASCTSPALYYYSCACGEVGLEVFTFGETRAHDFVTVAGYPATCTEDGNKTETCKLCGEQKNVTISALGHRVVVEGADRPADELEPTCKDAVICSYCNEVVKPVSSEHSWGEWYVSLNPQYPGDSTEERVCAICKEKETKTIHYSDTYGDLSYTVSGGEVTITDCNESATSVTIPSSIDGHPVTSIGDGAFNYCYSLTRLSIPDSVKGIGNEAFWDCISLTQISIPEGVTSIGRAAFSGCGGLESITVEEGNRFYHSNGNCLIETNSRTLISGCKNSVIPTDGSVTSIGDSAFYFCTELTSINIPDFVRSIGRSAFSGCRSLGSITVDEGNRVYHSNGNCLIETNSKTLIFGCKNSVIPTDGSVTSIGDSAFYACTGLAYISIPDSVTSIGEEAFFSCMSLESISIPNSVRSIGSFAFTGCHTFESVIIPNSVISIGDNAFWRCTNLESIIIPDSVRIIGNCALDSCTSLESVIIPDSVTSIGWRTFYNCTSLTSISIPDTVTSIGEEAFYGCESLTTVYYCGTAEEWNSISIDSGNTALTSATREYH